MFDNATASANSLAADGLYRVAALTGEQRYANHADRILQLLATVIEQYPGAASNAVLAVETRTRGLIELAIVGDAPELVSLAQRLWRPDVVLAWGEPFESPLWEGRRDGFAYLCRNFVCQQPVSEPEALYELITGRKLPDGSTIRRA